MILVMLSLFLGVSLVLLSLDMLSLVNDTCSFGVVRGRISLLLGLGLGVDFFAWSLLYSTVPPSC